MISNPEKTGIVHIRHLPSNLIYIKLKNKFKQELINEMRNKNKLYIVDSFKEGHAISLKKFKEIQKYLDNKKFFIKNLEKNISEIKTISNSKGIINPKLPFNFNSEEGGGIIAGFLFDGGINSAGVPNYSDTNLKNRISFVENMKRVFGDVHINKKELGEKRMQINFSKIIGVILQKLSIEKGSKLNKNKQVPSFILNGNKSIIKGFLQRAFEDEGSPNYSKKKAYRRINFEQNIDVTNLNQNIRKLIIERKIAPKCPSTILQIKQLLKKLKIESSIHFSKERNHLKGISHTIGIIISGKENLENFQNNIDFLSQIKKEKLQNMLKSYKQIQYRNGEAKENIFKICKNLQKKKEDILCKDILKISKRSKPQINNILRKLNKENKIEILNPSKRIGGNIPFNIYKIKD